jgi:hypothetical protein
MHKVSAQWNAVSDGMYIFLMNLYDIWFAVKVADFDFGWNRSDN